MNIFQYFNFKYLFFFLTFLSFDKSQAFVGKYPIKNFTPSDYKAGIQNIDFSQNRDMNLFVANNLGILEYNGIEWNLHTLNTGKKDRSLAFDEKTNRLYVGSQGAIGFFQDNWEYFSLTESIPEEDRDFDEVWDVYIQNDILYFCTFEAIFAFNGISIQTIKVDEGFERTFQVGGSIIAESRNGVLLEIKENGYTPFNYEKNKSGSLSGIIRVNDGYLFFYKSGEIQSTSLDSGPLIGTLSKELEGKYINHLAELSDSKLVISTQTAGLYIVDLQSNQLDQISLKEGLLSNACLRTFQDHEGNIWVGMQNGLAMIDINSPLRFINKEINLQGSGYDSYETEEGKYFTSSNGIYFLEKGRDEIKFLLGTEGPSYSISLIGGMLYAGHHTGLFELKGGEAIKVFDSYGLWRIKRLQSKPEFAIAGTYSGLLLVRILPDKELQLIGKIEQFDESSRFFEEDQRGKIWVGQFYKGLYLLELSEDLLTASVKYITPKDSDQPLEQIILSKINDELLVASKRGLFEIDQKKEQVISSELFYDVLGEQQIHLIEQDKQKNVHVITDEMVGFFKPISANNYKFVPSSLYQLRFSLNNDLLNVSFNSNSGAMFSANEGFMQYSTDLEENILLGNSPVIKRVLSPTQDSILFRHNSFEPRSSASYDISVSHKAKLIQFEVESYGYKNTTDKQFRYFLSGIDDDYGIWTNSSVKEYTNLKPGEYEFSVQTRNYIGQIETSEVFKLKVKPPFYFSTIAKIFYFGLFCIVLYLFYRLQKIRYVDKAIRIEIEKREELAKKQKELEEKERHNQEKLSSLKEEKLKSELSHLQNQLASSTMNLVAKNEFIEKIKSRLQELNKQDKHGDSNKTLENIVHEIDVSLRLQEDWENFELYFDKVHGDFLNRLRDNYPDLSPNDQKLCVFLRLNLNTKDIANLMNISLRGVEVARYRLRKKLNLKKGENLANHILYY